MCIHEQAAGISERDVTAYNSPRIWIKKFHFLGGIGTSVIIFPRKRGYDMPFYCSSDWVHSEGVDSHDSLDLYYCYMRRLAKLTCRLASPQPGSAQLSLNPVERDSGDSVGSVLSPLPLSNAEDCLFQHTVKGITSSAFQDFHSIQRGEKVSDPEVPTITSNLGPVFSTSHMNIS
ncbi:hypothetical protein NQZ68_019217 [Dissostichus eleginoides]|nr:hypothetical protein NQZ68_019217 [Dissostichus eleginoides]